MPQEHKLQDKAVSDLQAKMGLHGWRHTWLCSQESKGQAGVAIFSRCLGCAHSLDVVPLASTCAQSKSAPDVGSQSSPSNVPGAAVMRSSVPASRIIGLSTRAALKVRTRLRQTVCRIKPLSITRGLGKAKHDAKTARVLTAEFESFYLVRLQASCC